MKNLLIVCLCLFSNGIVGQISTSNNGFVKIYYPNGKISSEGMMVNGKPDGFWKTYYVNGVVKSEGNRKNHLLDSLWIFYNEFGDTLEKINYVLGKKNGYSFKYTSAEQKNSGKKTILISKEMFVNDSREGTSFYYYPEGTIHEIINYKNNKRHGSGREFDKQGVVITLYEFFNDYITDKQNINRISNGIKTGIWKEFYEDGKLKTEKEFKNDNLSGYAKEFDKSGKVTLNLLYREGKLVDRPKQDSLDIDEKIDYDETGKVKKRGYFRKGIPVGIHREYDINGKVVNAYIYNESGKVVSKGIINEDGSREGSWIYFFDDGEKKSEGTYVNNRQNGEWKFFFKDGINEQIGNFRNGVLNGTWKWFYSNGKPLRNETFLNGRRDGLFVEFNAMSDTIAVGSYQEGEMEGPWKFISGDMIESGTYNNGLKEGLWKEYYKNGVLAFEGNFISGNADGKHVYYFPDGKIREEQYYVNGFKEKVWKKYNEGGILFLAVSYENDTEVKVNGIKLEIVKKN
jgi:antitoxin component YwqK of YwqJK toxin-antitoxin module